MNERRILEKNAGEFVEAQVCVEFMAVPNNSVTSIAVESSVDIFESIS